MRLKFRQCSMDDVLNPRPNSNWAGVKKPTSHKPELVYYMPCEIVRSKSWYTDNFLNSELIAVSPCFTL